MPSTASPAVPTVTDSDRLTLGPWWTEADQGELDCLVRDLADGVWEHRTECARCALEHPPCPHVQAAIDTVIDWRSRRELLSRARWLRLQRDTLEYEQDLLAHHGRRP